MLMWSKMAENGLLASLQLVFLNDTKEHRIMYGIEGTEWYKL